MVIIEDNTGESAELRDDGSGHYNLADFPFDYSKRYRLNVQCSDGSTYQSDFVPPIKTSPIDSVVWRVEGDKVMFYVNTHNFESTEPMYYLWDWKDTWEHWTYFHSSYYTKGGRVVLRRPDEQVDVCWSSTISPSILTFSTRSLSKNIVRDFKINEIDGHSKKLHFRYSINVRQRSLTKEAYDYWQLLKTANESTGGLFAPLPPEVHGNFKSVGSDKVVLGYFSAGTTSEQRIYVKFNQLPDHIRAFKLVDGDCVPPVDSGPAIFSYIDLSVSKDGIPLIDVAPNGYYIAAAECLDCRVRGGTNVRPLYWPN